MKDNDENDLYVVVINDEGQYSIWPHWKSIPVGWSPVGESGLRDECLKYIEVNWTDMRPISLRGN